MDFEEMKSTVKVTSSPAITFLAKKDGQYMYSLKFSKRDKCWFIYFRDSFGRAQASCKTDNEKKATKDANQIYLEAVSSRIDKRKQCIYLEHYRETYLEQMRLEKGRPKTLRTVRNCFNWLIKEIGNRRIDEISPDEIEQAIYNEKYGLRSRRKYYGHLRGAFEKLKLRGKIDSNPFQTVRKPPDDPVTTECFTDAEFECLYKTIPNWTYEGRRQRAISLLAVDTGMRLGELRNLKQDAIDYEKMEVTVKENITKQVKTTFNIKNSKRRVVKVSQRALDGVVKLVAENKELRYECAKNTEFIFIDPQKGTVIGEGTISKDHTKYRRIVLPHRSKLNFHALRHSYGTAQANAGVPILEIMSNMGHSSVKVTERYIHTEHLAKEATDRFLANRKEIT
jgi:integrase